MVKAGAQLNTGHTAERSTPFLPEQVELVYWFANLKGQTERFPYDGDQHNAIEQSLSATIAEIAALDLTEWPLAADHKKCAYCPYKTLCDREDVETTEEPEDEPELEPEMFDLDLEQIAEIEF